MPLLLFEKNRIPNSVKDWISTQNINSAYVIGGTGVVPDSLLNQLNGMVKQDIRGNRLGGLNRYETNAKVIEKFYGSVVDKAYITRGLPLADALTSGPVASINGSPVILSNTTLTSTQQSILKHKTTNKIIQVGGTVSQTAVQNLKELLGRTE